MIEESSEDAINSFESPSNHKRKTSSSNSSMEYFPDVTHESGDLDKQNPFSETKGASNSKVRPVDWESDYSADHCCHCFKTFTFILRRHHCRGCGKIFCAKCARHWIQLPEGLGYENPERTCDECWKKYGFTDFSKIYDVAGPTDGQAIVLLHPALFTRMFWSQQVSSSKGSCFGLFVEVK